MPDLAKETVLKGFDKPGLTVITDKNELEQWFTNRSYNNSNLVLMSSGNYDGLDVNAFAQKITALQ
jgi:UDP-N-acetylmuramate: L-alanyl-gamma-D-glutamyl-meso-diaminopimelate ligase